MKTTADDECKQAQESIEGVYLLKYVPKLL